MKKSLVLILAMVFFGVGAVNSPKQSTNYRPRFRHGEELTYSLKYGPLHGGDATLKLRLTEYRNKEVFHARMHAKSVGLTDKLFKVEDIYESYFDTKTCLPYKAIRNISEGGYKFYNEVFFEHGDSSLYSQKSGEFEVPPDILDVVSSLYYLRSMRLDTLVKGDVLNIVTFFGDEVFPFPLRYKGKEIVKTKIGRFKCYRFDPVVEVGRIFESEDDMSMWISADENMVPIRVRFDMIVGAVLCDLVEYKGLATKLERLPD